MSRTASARRDRGAGTPSPLPVDRSGLPENVTFHDLVRRNRRDSVLLLAGMGVLLAVTGTVLGTTLIVFIETANETFTEDDLGSALLIAGIVSVLLAIGMGVWSIFSGSDAVLRIAGARPVGRDEDPTLVHVVEELAIAAGIPAPKVFLIEDDALNAFATGRDPEHGAVAITTGLRGRLNRAQLAGVIAHEISHIRHHDIRLALLMTTMVGFIVLACDFFLGLVRWHAWTGGGRRSRGGGDRGGIGGLIILVLGLAGILLSLVAPMLAALIRFAMSRQREYLADAGAVAITRNPYGLIGALETIGACAKPVRSANRATAHLYVVNPLKSGVRGRGHETNSRFRTHPPLHDRIARLRALVE